MPNKKLTDVEKLAIVQEIEGGHIGINAAVKKFGFSKSTLMKWRNRYRLYGMEGLAIRSKASLVAVNSRCIYVECLKSELTTNAYSD